MPRSLLIVIDTETTGLPPDPNVRPLQTGAVAFARDTGEEISEFRVLLRPDTWSTHYRRAEQVHGLTRDHCEENGVGMAAGYEKFTAWLRTLGSRHPWVGGEHRLAAWNAKFDHWMIQQWQKGAYMRAVTLDPWPSFSVAGYTAEGGCLQAAYRNWAEDQPDVATPKYGSLASAARVFSLGPQPTPHDAVSDARLAGQVWWAMECWHRANRGR
jgi:DNA polymerase III epsilon subunit-like protein